MSAADGASNNLDVIFTEIGEFGLFQAVSLVLICIPSLLSASYVVNYIFTANALNYRFETYTKKAIQTVLVHEVRRKRAKENKMRISFAFSDAKCPIVMWM